MATILTLYTAVKHLVDTNKSMYQMYVQICTLQIYVQFVQMYVPSMYKFNPHNKNQTAKKNKNLLCYSDNEKSCIK